MESDANVKVQVVQVNMKMRQLYKAHALAGLLADSAGMEKTVAACGGDAARLRATLALAAGLLADAALEEDQQNAQAAPVPVDDALKAKMAENPVKVQADG